MLLSFINISILIHIFVFLLLLLQAFITIEFFTEIIKKRKEKKKRKGIRIMEEKTLQKFLLRNNFLMMKIMDICFSFVAMILMKSIKHENLKFIFTLF